MLRRYNLPSKHLEGWAIIVIDTDGYFSTVSDYGNYAYHWSSMGVNDLRKFLVSCDADYIRRKLDPSVVLDERATERALKEIVLRARRHRQIDDYEAREAWDRARVNNDVDVHDWFNNFPGKLPDDYYEAYQTMANPRVIAFVENVLPRFQALLRAELGAEANATSVQP